MGYQVLARKWRPGVFSELVGQEHVVSAISNALDNNRLHHAYLFTGTRGVGKTTIARIFSKSLNCEQGMSSTPCGQCATCLEIEQGNYVDLLEIDAASRTKVEDTRDLLDNVQYKPTRGEYKVYLIDEVHMLSKHSFNALLKTLEEPPPHVKFLLATTDPQKLPITILSRCLQFNLKALSRAQMEQQLQHILQQEQISFEQPALAQLAKAAQGSMRDALSLTDQAIAQGNNQVSMQVVSDMLGLMDKNQVLKLLHGVIVNDRAAVFDMVEQLASLAPDYGRLLSELMSLLHQVALTQFVPDACKLETTSAKAIHHLAKQAAPEHVQLLYQIALQGKKDLPHAGDGRTGLEMTLLRMLAFRPESASMTPEQIADIPQQSHNTDNVAGQALQQPTQQQPVEVTPSLPQQSPPALAEVDDNEAGGEQLQALQAEQQQIQQQAEQMRPQGQMEAIPPVADAPLLSEQPLPEQPLPEQPLPEQAPPWSSDADMGLAPEPSAEPSPLPESLSPPTDADVAAPEAPQTAGLSDMQRKIAVARKLRSRGPEGDPAGGKKSEPESKIGDGKSIAGEPGVDEGSLLNRLAKGDCEGIGIAPEQQAQPVAAEIQTVQSETIQSEPIQAETVQSESIQSETIQPAFTPQTVVEAEPEVAVEPMVLPTGPNDLPPWLEQTDTSAIDPELAEFLGTERAPLEAQQAFDPNAHLQSERDYPVDKSVPVFLDDGSKVVKAPQLDEWSRLIESMSVAALTKQLALHSGFKQQGDDITLTLAEDKQHLHNDTAHGQLQQALSKVLQCQVTLNIEYGDPINTPYGIQQEINRVRQGYAEHTAQQDETIMLLRNTFDASVVEDSIKPR